MTRPVIQIALDRPSIIEEIIFLGTGCSSSTPLISCLMQEKPTCKVCLDAASSETSKNRRLNPSVLVRYRPSDGGPLRNILIDCGKTFYSAALQYLVRDKIGPLEAVILTHGHADAILGLDDLRHFTGHHSIQDHVDIWADKLTLDTISQTFPYLINPKAATGGGFVSDLKFHLIQDYYKPFKIGELSINPVLVDHGTYGDGSPFPCLAFLLDQDRFAYISDVSGIPSRTMDLLHEKELLVIDCLRQHRPYKSHFVLAQDIETIQMTRPKETFFVGMAHDVEHEEFQQLLSKSFPEHSIRLAYDGLVLQFKHAA